MGDLSLRSRVLAVTETPDGLVVESEVTWTFHDRGDSLDLSGPSRTIYRMLEGNQVTRRSTFSVSHFDFPDEFIGLEAECDATVSR